MFGKNLFSRLIRNRVLGREYADPEYQPIQGAESVHVRRAILEQLPRKQSPAQLARTAPVTQLLLARAAKKRVLRRARNLIQDHMSMYGQEMSLRRWRR